MSESLRTYGDEVIVSVITPAYNAGNFIADTIRTVLDQSLSDWEMIIMDDGSKDGTRGIIEKFLADPRISYHHQANSGVSSARNNAMAFARGKYIALLDADDLLHPDDLLIKVNELEKDSSIDWVFSDHVCMDESGSDTIPGPEGTDENMLEHFFLWDREVVPVPCSNIVFRTALFRNGAAFDPKLSTTADRCFCVQLAIKGKAKRIPKRLVRYRVLPGSMSRNMTVTERDNLYFYSKYDESGYLKPFFFRARCYSNIYLILAGSWNLYGNRKRGILFLLRSFLSYPPSVFRIIGKVIHRKKKQ